MLCGNRYSGIQRGNLQLRRTRVQRLRDEFIRAKGVNSSCSWPSLTSSRNQASRRESWTRKHSHAPCQSVRMPKPLIRDRERPIAHVDAEFPFRIGAPSILLTVSHTPYPAKRMHVHEVYLVPSRQLEFDLFLRSDLSAFFFWTPQSFPQQR